MTAQSRATEVRNGRRWSRRTHRLLFVCWVAALALAALVLAADHSNSVHDGHLPSVFWFASAALLLQAVSRFDDRRGQPAWAFVTWCVALLAVIVMAATSLLWW